MSIRYVIKITTDRGADPQYLKAVGIQYPTFRLVAQRSQATQLESQAVAELLSSHFWYHHWKECIGSYNGGTREVVTIKKRIKE